MKILEVSDLKKDFGKGENMVSALRGITFSVEQGAFVGIVGSSGSGKSTLLNILGALELPTAGKVRIGDRNINELGSKQLTIFRRRYVGFIFQNYNLIPALTGYDNIVLPLTFDFGREIDQKYMEEIMKKLNIEDQQCKYPSEMSGGQQQRIAIARALANRPSLILADEPTGNLDSKTSLEVVCLLKESCKYFGQTVIMVTHNEDLAQLCDYLIHIEDGRIIKDGE